MPPWDGFKYVEQEWHYVDAGEFARLMSAARPAWQLMFGLARRAGLRAEEALELPWRMVDLDKGRISVSARDEWQPKDGDARIIPISPALQDLLRAARDGDPHGAMVIPRGSIAVSNIWRDLGP